MSGATITLGGRAFPIRRLTLGQIRELCVSQAEPVPAEASVAERRSWERMLRTVVVALSRDNPEVTEEAVLEMEATLTELTAAHVAILKFSGLVKSGEAEAATSTGAASTGA
jgi:hypothetical protein